MSVLIPQQQAAMPRYSRRTVDADPLFGKDYKGERMSLKFLLHASGFVFSTLLCGPGFAHGQTILTFPGDTPPVEVQPKYTGIVNIKVDNTYQCMPDQTAEPVTQDLDSLNQIIADMERHDRRHNPIQAGREGDREALRHLPRVNSQAGMAATAFSRQLLARYKALGTSGLKGDAKLNHALLGYVLEKRLALVDFDPSRLPFTNDSGFFSMMNYVSRQTSFKEAEDYKAYAARLSELPRFFEEHKVNMRRGIATGHTASEEILPGVIAMVRDLSDGKADDHSLFQPFKTFPASFDATEKARLQRLGLETVNMHVLPAYKDLLIFFETEYAPYAREVAGIGTSPENREYYKELVKYFTTLDLTPDEVHRIGLDEVTRIRAEMNAIIDETGFEGDFKEFLGFLRADEQFYAKTAEDLMKEAAWIAKRIDGQMPKFFGQLPRLPYGVMVVPDEIASHYTAGRYWGGNLENGVAGNYMVNTYNLKQRPLYNLPALTLHEGVPGHHHQISLGQELKDVPAFRQSLYPDAFGEGWGLYAEKLGVEMGIYRTLYEDFGRLTYEMWRACRLVVDTGIHWKGWSREQAESCFFENSALAAHNIRTEIERYISWPGQALAYKIGELKIWELRRKAEKDLGDKFDIRAFHDAVLGNGGIPLKILEGQINNWILVKNQVPHLEGSE